MPTILDYDKPVTPKLQTYIPATKQTLTGQAAVDYLAQNGGSKQQVSQMQNVLTLPKPAAPAAPAPQQIPGFAAPPTPQQQANLAAATPRAAPTVATAQQPLITKNQLPSGITQPAANPQTMLENIAMKKYKGQALNDDEVRFQIKQAIGTYRPDTGAGKNMGTPAPRREQYRDDASYNAAVKRFTVSGGSMPNGQQPAQNPPILPNAQNAQSNPVINQNPPIQPHYRANISGNPPTNPLPGQYQSEDEFASTDPAGYDQWANSNGYHYSIDDVNYSANPPPGIYGDNPSITDYANATPEQQMQMQQQGFQKESQQQQDLLNSGYDQIGAAQDAKIRTAQDRLANEKVTLEGADAAKVDEFTKDQQAQDQVAINQVNKANDKNINAVKEMESFSGFGRSTKTQELIADSGESTKNIVADIERQSKRAVTEYQVSLLDRTQARLDKLQEKVDATQDEKDALAVTKVKDQMSLMKDLFSQNPMSPKNMQATAEKLQSMQIEKRKMALEERKQVTDDARANFQFMVQNFGSGYLQNLDDNSINNLSANLGVPASAIKSMGPTLQEADTSWKKYIDTRNFDYQKENDATQRDFQWTLNQEGNRQDLEKMGISFKQDISKMYLGEQFKDAESQRKFAGLTYGEFGAQSSGGNSSGLTFDNPVAHPATGAPTVALNPKIANAYPAGYKKAASSGPGGLGGQCAYEVEQMCDMPAVGNSVASKTKALNSMVNQGKGFLKGQGTPQPGDVLISSLSKTYGHVAMVNAVTKDGKLVLSEFNVKAPLTFSNSRTIDPNSNEVIGFMRVPLKTAYQMDKNAQTLDQGSSTFKKSASTIDPNSSMYKILMGQANQMDAALQGGSNQNSFQPSSQPQNSGSQFSLDEDGYKLTPDRMNVRSGNVPESFLNQKYQDLSAAVNTGAISPKALQAFEKDAAIGQAAAEKKKSDLKGSSRPLDASTTLTIGKFTDVGSQLDDIYAQYQKLSNPDPISGEIALKNPYNTDVQQLNRMITAVVPSLARGVFGEVGVLTDSDVERYTKLLADGRTPKDQAEQAMQFIKNRVANGRQNLLTTLGNAGYDVENFTQPNFSGANQSQGSQGKDSLGLGFSSGGGFSGGKDSLSLFN